MADWDKISQRVSKTTNSRSHEDVTWQKLEVLDSKLAEKIKDLAEDLGYEIDSRDSSAHHALNIDALDENI